MPVEAATPTTRLSDVDVLLLRAELREALAGINAEHLAAVIETIVWDRPYDEVAAELGVPVGTIKSRVHYALRRLRMLIENAEQAA